jgi:hypothetical protein
VVTWLRSVARCNTLPLWLREEFDENAYYLGTNIRDDDYEEVIARYKRWLESILIEDIPFWLMDQIATEISIIDFDKEI